MFTLLFPFLHFLLMFLYSLSTSGADVVWNKTTQAPVIHLSPHTTPPPSSLSLSLNVFDHLEIIIRS